MADELALQYIFPMTGEYSAYLRMLPQEGCTGESCIYMRELVIESFPRIGGNVVGAGAGKNL
ncbi:MAG: hypothetical protein CVV44_20595 [Spirochaetae bacterium HGW-Spirochaetae-1]|jgi:hypothetical protein|nr:MAG: hypothetical protein CVV44_20595 [Spirochaetae bacterium HGW-Spirochaetae-1]